MPPMVGGQGVIIFGGNFTQNNHPHADLQKFHENIAKDVFHNSQKRSEEANPRNVNDITNQWTERLRRMPVPSTHSRDSLFDALVVEDVIKDIFIWLHDPSTHCLAMWVYDDDRSLTSLIGQVVAEILAKRNELSATYFFPREQVTDPGTDATCSSLVVPTIAYQLVQNIPEVKACIAGALAHQVSIFNLRVQDQVTKLVIEPLRHASESLEQLPQRASANVIVVHALEDCDNPDFQMIFLEEFLRGLASIEAIPYSQRLLLLGRSTDHLRECFLNLPAERMLQRPVHIQPWRTREQDIHRREQKLMKDEEDLCKKLAHVKQQQEAAQQAWKLRLQVKKAEEGVKQREERLRQQEGEFRRRQEQFLQRETAIAEKEKNLGHAEKDLEKRMGEVEKKAKETQLREDAAKQVSEECERKQQEMREELLQREQVMSVAWDAEVEEIQKMKNELDIREQSVISQIEELKKRQDEALKREQQIVPKAFEVKEKQSRPFRILVIGNNRAGKTSLVRSILKIDTKDAHDDAASSRNIEHEYTSTENIRFILHDIPSFQVENGGQNENADVLKTVERFLRPRSKRNPQERVHGIWFCIDLHPQFRYFGPKYTIDKEKVFSLAKELNVPVLAVFTRFDLLVNEQRRDRGDLSETDLEHHAENWLHEDIRRRKLVPPESAPFVKVSTSENYPRRLERLQELTEVTLKHLDKYYGLDKRRSSNRSTGQEGEK